MSAGTPYLAMLLAPGSHLDHYEIRHLLGKGGMGEVYLAWDARLKRQVAVKLLSPAYMPSEAHLRRFEREAHTASSLNHPNILTIYEIGEADGRPFIVSEYVRGESLRRRLERSRMGLKDVLEAATQVASALVAAHEAGVVHRDIKPENIMLRDDGYVKVLDFGLAKPVGESATGQWVEAYREAATYTQHTGPGVVVGTAPYMSPEQSRGLDVDSRSDVWSVGVVLYEMASGTAPFGGETPHDVLAAILRAEPPPLPRGPAGQAGLERIIGQALCKDRERRYQSARELLADLNDLRYEVDLAAKHGQSVSSERAGTDERESRLTERNRSPVESTRNVGSLASSLRYAVGKINWRKMSLTVVSAALMLMVAYLTYNAPRGSAITSVAVLPFVNVQGDQEMEYLSDGLSESLISRLSRLGQVKVTARNSSFKFKGSAAAPKEIAEALGVRALVTGRVVRRGEDLQVSVELIDARDGAQLWGGQYSRRAANLQALQADIAEDLSSKLRLQLTREERWRMDERRDDDAEVYSLYLKGRYHWNKLTPEGLKKSIEYFSEAVERDPRHALSYAGLANSYITLGANDLPAEETYPKAAAFVRKALELDDTLAEAHYASAVIKLFYDWNLPGAEAELNRTLELNPNYAAAYSMLGHVRLAQGRPEDAVPQLKRALAIDPFSLLFNVNLSYAFFHARQYEQAAEHILKTLEQAPDASFLYGDLCGAYARLGRYDEAVTACQKVIILSGDEPWALSTLGVTYALWGKKEEARWVVKTMENAAEKKYVQPYHIASVYAALGEVGKAIEWLERAFAERSSFLVMLGVDPTFDSIRSHPDYMNLRQRMNLR